MSAAPRCCVCSDAADRAIIRALADHDASVELVCSGERLTVAVDLIPGAIVGDVVLVHQGVAIAKVPADANEPEEIRS